MLKRMKLYASVGIMIASFGLVGASIAADEYPSEVTLFKKVNIFDGVSDQLKMGYDVLVVGNKIKKIDKDIPSSGNYEVEVTSGGEKQVTVLSGYAYNTYTISVKEGEAETKTQEVKVNVIDAGGRTLMPGLIEGHGHLQMNGTSIADIENNRSFEDLASRAVVNAENALMSGYTSWRDAGGMAAGLQRTIDQGLLIGPRIYPSGGFIGPTGSHADFRSLTSPNETLFSPNTSVGRLGMSLTADGPTQIKAAARQNFMQGATQIKIMSSGGVVSQFDPWQLDAYSPEEISAAVEVAEAYHTYVMSHAYSKKSIMRCLENGVKTIEHGFMFDEEIAMKMEEVGAYMTTNMQAFSPLLGQVSAISSSPASARKAASAQLAFENYVENVKKFRPKLGFQGDCVGVPDSCNLQNDHQIYLGAMFFGNHYWLKALTSVNGEILKLSGEVRDPYPEGKIGVVEEGAYADLLLVDGNPLEDITVIGGNEKWFDAEPRPAGKGIETMRIIMKDGKIYKNTL